MTGLRLVAETEDTFITAGRKHEQDPRAVDARVLEAVPGASWDEDKIARAGDEGACPIEDLDLAGENEEGLVGPRVHVGDRSAARRHGGLDQCERAVSRLARCLDRVGVPGEPGSRTLACTNVVGSACEVWRASRTVELLFRERHVRLLRVGPSEPRTTVAGASIPRPQMGRG